MKQKFLAAALLSALLFPLVAAADFTHNLRPGTKDPDVKTLQQFLNQHGYTVALAGPGAQGSETTYYGPATKAALKLYQAAYRTDILVPAGITLPTGLFYTMTRAHVNKRLSATMTTAQTPVPSFPALISYGGGMGGGYSGGGPTTYGSGGSSPAPTSTPASTSGGGGGGSSPAPVTLSPTPPSPSAISGSCGTSNGQSFTSAPNTNLCASGSTGSVSGSGPWGWSCAGSNGGSTASCSAGLAVVNPSPAPTPTPTPAASQPVTVVLQNGVSGYVGTIDTFTDTWSPARNYDTGGLVPRQGGEQKVLIKFDLSSIPQGSQVTSAQLDLYENDALPQYPGPGLYQVNRILKDWSETAATWLSATASTLWAQAGMGGGTDYVATADATLAIPTGIDTIGWKTFPITALVNSWMNGTANYGAVLAITSSNPNHRAFADSEDATIANRPKLTVTYLGTGVNPTPTPPPASPSAISGSCGTSNGQSFTSAPNTNLCASGSTGSVSGSGPWGWSCAGSNGGSTASCSAGLAVVNPSPAPTPPVPSPSPTPSSSPLVVSARPYLFKADEARLRASIAANDPEAVGSASNNQGTPIGFLTLAKTASLNRASYSDISTWNIALAGWLANDTAMLDIAKGEAMAIVNAAPAGDTGHSDTYQHVEERLLNVAAVADLAYSRFTSADLAKVAAWTNGTLDNWNTGNLNYWPYDATRNNYWQNGFLANVVGGIATEGFNSRAGEFRTNSVRMANLFTAQTNPPQWSGPVQTEGHYYSAYVTNALWALELYDTAAGTSLTANSYFAVNDQLNLLMYQTRPDLTSFFEVGSEASISTAPFTLVTMNYWQHLIASAKNSVEAQQAKAILAVAQQSNFWGRQGKGFVNFYWNTRSTGVVPLTAKTDRLFAAPTPGAGLIGVRSSAGFQSTARAALMFANYYGATPEYSHSNPDAPGFQWADGANWIVTDPEFFNNSGIIAEAGSGVESDVSNIVTLAGVRSNTSGTTPLIEFAEDRSTASVPHYYAQINAQPYWNTTSTYRREYVWLDDLQTVVIFDRIIGGSAKKWRLHLPSAPTISGSTATYVTGGKTVTVRDLYSTAHGAWSSSNLNGTLTTQNVWRLSQDDASNDYASVKVLDIGSRVSAASAVQGAGYYQATLTIAGATRTIRFHDNGTHALIN